MTDTLYEQERAPGADAANRLRAFMAKAMSRSGPPLLFGLRLWASVCLALYVAFWLQLDNAVWAGTSAAIVCQPQLGASLRKGWYRMIGTLIGAVVIVVLTAWFVQDRAAFLLALALWGGACALLATLLRNFTSYAAALAGYTAAIIAADTLGATGGPNVDVFMLAVSRGVEICVGIVCAGVVLAGTDLGGAQRRLAASFAALIADITSRFTGMLAQAGPGLPETQPMRRELVRRTIALDPAIELAIGESARLRARSPVLQTAVDGLLAALCGWRAVAVSLAHMPGDQAQHEANLVLHSIPQKLRSAPERSEPAAWMADPLRWRRLCDVTGRTLSAAPAATPSRRLLNDQTAKALTGIADALNGLALLTDGAVRPDHRHRGLRFQVADWLPPLVNGARAFIVIGAASLFWIATAWPQGASAAAFAAIVVILFSPYADQASAASVGFMIGTVLAAALVAIIKFAVLPGIDTFEALSIVLGLYLIPIGALMMHGWQPTIFTGMIIAFVPLLAPANQMTYSTVDYYNAALAIITGGGAAALSFRLIPALSPAFRARRLLTLHLRDLRRLAAGDATRTVDDWEACAYGRLSALPDQATPLQRSQFVAALAVGAEIIRLRSMVSELDLGADADVAFAALAQGQSPAARAQLEKIDRDLSLIPGSDSQSPLALQARAAILMISEALAQHASYFDAGERI